MDASNSLKKNSLLKEIKKLYPSLSFAEGELFRWDSELHCIYYDPESLDDPEGQYNLLHELAHALLGHANYTYDVALVQMEAEAWQRSHELAAQFGLSVDPAYAEGALDTYRGWLSGRSMCPACAMTGVQQTKNTYQCINCRCRWRVNDAKFCALRRFKVA